MAALETTGRPSDGGERRSEQGTVFPAEAVRGFIQAALCHDAVADVVNDLLFEHVVNGRYHPSVVSASLRPMIDEVLNVATDEDWRLVTSHLISDAREALGIESD